MSSAGAFWTRDLGDISLQRIAHQFSTWYRQELFALFPSSTLAWLNDRGERRMTVSAASGFGELRAVDSAASEAAPAPVTADELRAASLDEALTRRGLSRETTKIVLKLPRDAFFLRRTVAPLAAQQTLPRLLAAELERKTPFRPSDVVFGYVATPHGGDKLDVEQWILRRDFVAAALAPSGLALEDVDGVEPEWSAPTPPPVIVLRQRAPASKLLRNTAIALCALAALLLAAGLGVLVLRQDRLGDELDAKIAEMSARAARVRQVADRATADSRLLATLREERARYPALADIWEEVSRIMPDSAFALELRLSEQRVGERVVDLSGYAESAAGLPALFDRSPLFSDAGLTAPITADIREKRDTFAIQARVRGLAVEARK